MFFWKKNKLIDQFAVVLADEISQKVPSQMVKPGTHRNTSVARISRILESSYAKAKDFKSQHGLGMFGKARLGNAFRWRLKELGYDQSFIDVATEGLVVYISKN